MKTLLTAVIIFFSSGLLAQSEKSSVVIGSQTHRPNALLVVNPQNSDQGVLLPQLSTGQRNALKPSSPSEDGLIVFDKTVNAYFYWTDNNWVQLSSRQRSRHFSLDPAAFQELKSGDNIRHSSIVVFDSDNSFVTTGRGGKREIIAPVNLPHDAVLSEFTVYYQDDHQNNIRVQLFRKDFSGVSDEIISWESSGANPAVASQSISNFKGKAVIDLENYTYRVIVRFDLDENEDVESPSQARQRLYGIKIRYEE